jgi:hypothetical protein
MSGSERGARVSNSSEPDGEWAVEDLHLCGLSTTELQSVAFATQPTAQIEIEID